MCHRAEISEQTICITKLVLLDFLSLGQSSCASKIAEVFCFFIMRSMNKLTTNVHQVWGGVAAELSTVKLEALSFRWPREEKHGENLLDWGKSVLGKDDFEVLSW